MSLLAQRAPDKEVRKNSTKVERIARQKQQASELAKKTKLPAEFTTDYGTLTAPPPAKGVSASFRG